MNVLREFERHQSAGACSIETIRLRGFQLARLARDHGGRVLDLTTVELEAWLANPDWSPSTRRSHRSTLRVFYAWAARTGRLEVDPAALLPAVRARRGVPRPAAEDDYARAVSRADDRLRRALRLGGECGLRRSEIARVRVEDLERDLVGWCLRVRGKGDHVRLVPLPDDLAEDLLTVGAGWVFPSPGRGGHLTPAHLGKLVSAALGSSTHTLRHRAGTRAYDGTRDLRAVQEFLGHASPVTTAIYTKVERSSIRAAMSAAAAA